MVNYMCTFFHYVFQYKSRFYTQFLPNFVIKYKHQKVLFSELAIACLKIYDKSCMTTKILHHMSPAGEDSRFRKVL